MVDIDNLFSKMESSIFYKNKYLINVVCAIQNFIYKINSKKFKSSQNKILIAGGYNQFNYLIKKLKKNKNNVIIKGSIYPGRSLFRKNINYCIRFKENKQDIKEKIKNVDLIVVTNDVVPFEKMLISVAEEYGIPTLSIQHGMFSGEDYLYKPIKTTKMAIWGEITKKWLLKNKEDENKIEVVGAPMLDKYVIRKVDKKEVRKSLNISINKKVLLFASQPSLDNFSKILGTKGLTPNKNTLLEEKKTIRRLLDVTNALDYFLIIKLHPLGKPDTKELEKYIKNYEFKNYIIIKRGNIQDLISV